MTEFMVHLPTWVMIRTLGIASYALLAIGVILGILYGFPFWKGKTKANLYQVHSTATVTGTAVGLLHGVITVIDTYMPFDWSEVLVPFTAQHSPFLNGLGTLAGYGMLLVIFTTDIRHKLKKKVWLLFHLLAYPILIMSWIHGLFLGTDSSSLAVRWMYVGTLMIVLLLTVLRILLPASHGKTMGDGSVRTGSVRRPV